MLVSFDDLYMCFFDLKEFKEMQIDIFGELMGVGIQFSFDKDMKKLIVVFLIEGIFVFCVGVQFKDVIVFIDGVFIKGMIIEDVVKLI